MRVSVFIVPVAVQNQSVVVLSASKNHYTASGPVICRPALPPCLICLGCILDHPTINQVQKFSWEVARNLDEKQGFLSGKLLET